MISKYGFVSTLSLPRGMLRMQTNSMHTTKASSNKGLAATAAGSDGAGTAIPIVLPATLLSQVFEVLVADAAGVVAFVIVGVVVAMPCSFLVKSSAVLHSKR